jgi:uncharacterized membrane protein YbhN (UPF0104 family)
VKNKSVNFFRVIGILLFIYFLRKVDFQKFSENIHKIDLKYFYLAIVIALVSVIFRSYRTYILIKKVNETDKKITFFETYLIYYSGIFFGALTPSRVGEIFKMRFLKAIGKDEALYVIVADRIFDAVFILCAGIFSFFYFSLYYYIKLVLPAIVLGIITFFILKKFFINYFKEKFSRFFKEKYYKFSFSLILKVFFITFLSFFVYYVWYYILLKCVGINVPFFYALNVVNLNMSVNVLPITIMGLGTREAINLYFFSKLGYNVNDIMLFSFVIMFFYVFNIITGFLFWNLLEYVIKRRPDVYEI